MRKSAAATNPFVAITAYFVALTLLVYGIRWVMPAIAAVLPFGGIQDLIGNDAEIIATIVEPIHVGDLEAVTLAIAIIGAVLLAAPISWVYFTTTRTKQVDRSFAQTIMVLPVVVAGIGTIVQHSLALAFSLAGVVAAVRFRFALEEPAHALYIFVAIAIGLGAGISALDISFVVCAGFVYVNLLLWKLDYGADLTSPFFSFITGRGRDDNEL